MKRAWFWSVDGSEDDPTFMKSELSVPRSHREIVEELLNQLIEEEEGEGQEEADLGGRGYSWMSDESEGEKSTANGKLVGPMACELHASCYVNVYIN